MGRKRSYDKEEVIEKAMLTFWKLGYHNTSIADLEKSTGINRYGIYDSFGDKEGLFLACLDLYSQKTQTLMDSFLKTGMAGLKDFISSLSDRDRGLQELKYGCLAVACIQEKHWLTPKIRQKLEDNREIKKQSLIKLFKIARSKNQIDPDVSIESLVDFLMISVSGIMSQNRVSEDQTQTSLATQFLISILDRLIISK